MPLSEKIDLAIVIPFYKGESFIFILLNSLYKAFINLEKPFKIEILVLIDSMETNQEELEAAIVEIFSDRFSGYITIKKNNKNLGVAATRNLGLEQTKAAHILFIDQDDQVHEDYFRRLYPVIADNDFILINGLLSYSNGKSYKIYYLQPDLSLRNLMLDDFIKTPGQVVLRTRLFRETGFPQPAKHKGSDDRFAWINFFLNHSELKTCYIEQPLLIFNIHENNYSHNTLELRKSCLELWDQTIEKYPLGKHKKWANRDIYRIKSQISFSESRNFDLKGLMLFFYYKLRPYKVIRYAIRYLDQKLN